jgi:alanine dehydrogenase
MAIIGLIRESKKPYDKRVALSPAQCVDVMTRFTDVKIVVQPSPHRCISDAEYLEAGIEMSEDLEKCDILLGIKEVPIEDLIANKTYLFFSHTIKKQPHNRKLLRTILQKNIRLVDYETLVWENGSRVLGFGRFAGIVGTHNAFLTWGEKFNLFKLKPAYRCENYAEMKAEYDKIEIPPLKIALCGDGRVAHGCLELLNLLHIREVTPQEFLDEQFDVPTYVHLVTEDFYAHKDGELWDKADFYHNPENYVSTFKQYTQHCDVMLNAIFWNERIPRFFSKEDMKARDFKIKVIADISCDVNGSIPATMKDTTIEDPVFGYHPLSETIEAPFLKNTIDVMAVSNLPCELPYDASVAFGEQLIKYVMGNLLNAKNSRMIHFATIAQNGELTDRYKYLKDYVE